MWSGKKIKNCFKNQRWMLLTMTVPFFLCVVAFSNLPLWGWLIAFYDYFPGTSIFNQNFAGLRYFQRMLNDRYFYQALVNTLILSSMALLTYPIAPVFAILLNEFRSGKYKRIIQTLTSFPNFISWIIVFSIAATFFSVEDGLINQVFFDKLGWLSVPTNFLANADIAKVFQTFFLSVWKNCGWSAIIYLAAITGIDQSLYEAAKVDGAGRIKRIIYITIPGIMPTFIVLLVLGAANILNTGFDQYYVFTNAVTLPVLDNLDTYIYRTGIQNLNFSYATAVGMSRSIVSVLLLTVINRVAYHVNGAKII